MVPFVAVCWFRFFFAVAVCLERNSDHGLDFKPAWCHNPNSHIVFREENLIDSISVQCTCNQCGDLQGDDCNNRRCATSLTGVGAALSFHLHGAVLCEDCTEEHGPPLASLLTRASTSPQPSEVVDLRNRNGQEVTLVARPKVLDGFDRNTL